MTKYDILKYYEIALRDVENIIGVNSTSNFRIDKICMRIIPNYLGTFSSNNAQLSFTKFRGIKFCHISPLKTNTWPDNNG